MHRLPGLRKTLPLRRAYCGEDGENGEIVWVLKKKTDSASAESPFSFRRIDEAYELFENKRDGVIKVAVEC